MKKEKEKAILDQFNHHSGIDIKFNNNTTRVKEIGKNIFLMIKLNGEKCIFNVEQGKKSKLFRTYRTIGINLYLLTSLEGYKCLLFISNRFYRGIDRISKETDWFKKYKKTSNKHFLTNPGERCCLCFVINQELKTTGTIKTYRKIGEDLYLLTELNGQKKFLREKTSALAEMGRSFKEYRKVGENLYLLTYWSKSNPFFDRDYDSFFEVEYNYFFDVKSWKGTHPYSYKLKSNSWKDLGKGRNGYHFFLIKNLGGDKKILVQKGDGLTLSYPFKDYVVKDREYLLDGNYFPKD